MGHMKTRLLLAACTLLLALSAQAQIDAMLGKKVPPLLHPGGYYALVPPRSWSNEFTRDGQLIMQAKQRDQAELTITIKTLPAADADTELVALNHARALKKLPNFRDGGGGRLTIGGKPASIRSFEFDYNANTEYTISVEELYIVSGRVLVLVHFEVMKRSFPASDSRYLSVRMSRPVAVVM